LRSSTPSARPGCCPFQPTICPCRGTGNRRTRATGRFAAPQAGTPTRTGKPAHGPRPSPERPGPAQPPPARSPPACPNALRVFCRPRGQRPVPSSPPPAGATPGTPCPPVPHPDGGAPHKTRRPPRDPDASAVGCDGPASTAKACRTASATRLHPRPRVWPALGHSPRRQHDPITVYRPVLHEPQALPPRVPLFGLLPCTGEGIHGLHRLDCGLLAAQQGGHILPRTSPLPVSSTRERATWAFSTRPTPCPRGDSQHLRHLRAPEHIRHPVVSAAARWACCLR